MLKTGGKKMKRKKECPNEECCKIRKTGDDQDRKKNVPEQCLTHSGVYQLQK